LNFSETNGGKEANEGRYGEMRKWLAIVLCMTFLTAATLSYAGEVFVTKNGKKYHKATCILIKNKNAAPIDEKEAVAKGLNPCGKCFKDQNAGSTKTEKAK
jgi:hypothetical protein